MAETPPAGAAVVFPGPRTTLLLQTGLSVSAVRLPGTTTDHLLVGMTDGSLALVRYTAFTGAFETRQRLFLTGRLVGLLPWEGLPVSQRGVIVATADPDRAQFVSIADHYPFLSVVASVDLDEDPGGMAWCGDLGTDDARVAVAEPGLDAIALLAPAGGWHLAQVVPVGDDPRSLASTDLDGDGRREVVAAERGALSGDLALLTVGPGGTASVAFSRLPGLQAGLVAAYDDDGDGRDDVVVADRERPRVLFARLDGGAFAVLDSLTLTMPLQQLLAWRLADGAPALMAGNADRGAVEFASRGTAGWERRATYFPGCRPAALATGEFDGDGLTDIATVASGQAMLSLLMALPGPAFSGLPSLTLTTMPGDLALGDFDGDGRDDVLVPAAFEPRLSLFPANEGGVQTVGSDLALDFMPGRAIAVELDGDAARELVVLDVAAGQVAVFDDVGSGQPAPVCRRDVGAFPSGVAAADIDADGRVDLLVLAADRSQVFLLYGAPDGTFDAPVALTFDIDTVRAALPDLNADGWRDLVGVDGASRLWWRLNTGGRDFGPVQWAQAGLGATLIATGDLDGDLDQDVVVGCRLDQSLVSFQNDGVGNLVRRSGSYVLGSEPSGLTVGDFDQDGRGDVVVALRAQDRLDIYLGIVPWNHEYALTVSGTPDVQEFRVADINTDGRSDLLALDSSLQLGVVHLNLEPGGVAIEPEALRVACLTDGGLEARLEPGGAGPWVLDARDAAGWRRLADASGASAGRLEQESSTWRLVLGPADLDAWGRPRELRLTVTRADGIGESLGQAVAAPCGGGAEVPAGGPAWVDGPRPNPGNPSVRATFRLARSERVAVAVFDLAGRRVAVLADGVLAAGDHDVAWDGRSGGGAAPAGSYLLRVQTGSGVDSRKVTLLK